MRSIYYNLTMNKPLFFVIETLCLVGIPLVFVLLYPQLLPFRLAVMAAGSVYIFFAMKKNNLSLADIGVRKEHAMRSISYVAFPTLVFAVLLLVASSYFPKLIQYDEIVAESYGYPIWMPILFYVLISVPLQEFVLRGFYITRLELVSRNRLFLLLYSSFIFAIIHSAFQNKTQVPFAFLLSLYMGHVFLKFRSLAGPIFMHAVIGATFLWLVLR